MINVGYEGTGTVICMGPPNRMCNCSGIDGQDTILKTDNLTLIAGGGATGCNSNSQGFDGGKGGISSVKNSDNIIAHSGKNGSCISNYYIGIQFISPPDNELPSVGGCAYGYNVDTNTTQIFNLSRCGVGMINIFFNI